MGSARPPNGIVLLDKPLGLSSNAALQRVRRLLGAAKAGHVGSLDPLATGMLPICLNEATKVADDILSFRKCYRFELSLGVRTATGDREGSAVERLPVPPFASAHVESVLADFLGETLQVPPMYSALKRAGQPLYRLARTGIEVERTPRRIEISSLTLLALDPPLIRLETVCSKGTYIRVLAEDIARRLGTCGHVSMLRRLYVEPFVHEPMHTMEALEGACASGAAPAFIPADRAIEYLPEARLTVAESARIRLGQRIAAPAELCASRVRLYDAGGAFFGIGVSDGAGSLAPRRLFAGAAP